MLTDDDRPSCRGDLSLAERVSRLEREVQAIRTQMLRVVLVAVLGVLTLMTLSALRLWL